MNWYLVEEDGRLTAVDAGLPRFKGSLSSDLAGLGYGLQDIEALILTHPDADHIGIAPFLREQGVRVLIHSTDDPKLRKPGPKSGDASPRNMVTQLWRPTLWMMLGGLIAGGAARPRGVEDAEVFGYDDVLDVPGSPRVIATPGHTAGHCAFHFQSRNALFVGDAMCTWNPLTWGRGPQVMPHGFNESDDQARQSLEAIEGVDADVVFPGHGEPWREGAAAAAKRARAAL